MKKLMCDPPEGWRYGFPKSIPYEVEQNQGTRNWLIENGYPQSEIDKLGDYFFVRFWEQNDE